MLIRAPLRHYSDWITDSGRWDSYVPREGDVIIATAPKCGTTWLQRIVGLLISNDPAPRSVDDESPWYDMRLAPLDAILAVISAQERRRYLKSHLPFDTLPLFDEVRYIHVARDPRDACKSIHGMVTGTKADIIPDPEMARQYGSVPADFQDYFRMWLTSGVTSGQQDGAPFVSLFDLEVTFWSDRERSNLLLVHYADLKADLDGEMRRIAAFLDIAVDEAVWPELVNAATFAEMQKAGAQIKPHAVHGMKEGANGFFNKGVSGGWRDLLSDDDLALYHAKLSEKFSPGLAAWVEQGRIGAGDPRESAP